jgi:hypothetical protein
MSLSMQILPDATGIPVETVQRILSEPAPAPQWPTSVPWPYTGALTDLTSEELRGVVAYLRRQYPSN